MARGAALALLLAAYYGLLRDTVANTTLDLLHLSLHPLDSGARLALQIGLIVWHATVLGCGVLIVRAALASWLVPRPDWRLRLATLGFWSLPLVAWQFVVRPAAARQLPLLVALAAVIVLVIFATRLKARYRHGSQAFRLTLMTFGIVVPAFVFYPSIFQLA